MSDVFEYRDALPDGPVRGRGAGINPGNRFEAVRLHVLGEHLDQVQAEKAEAATAAKGGLSADGGGEAPDPTHSCIALTSVLPDESRTALNYIDPRTSPDIGFCWSINPYRGCEHGCIYCYARPTHETLGFSSGLDFETRIMAKHDAAKLLRRELAKPSWKGETIMMSGVTDCYQPLERELKITRSCLEVMAECRQAVGIVTKNRLVLRDLDLLTKLNEHRAVHVALSITTLDKELAAKMEPRASAPADRLHAVRELSKAGIPVCVMVAPVVPGLTDREIPAILAAAAEAGASAAGYVLLRLPYQVKELFLDWLRRQFPERAGHVESLMRSMRGGALYNPTAGLRMRGEGPMAEQIGQLFKVFERRHGLDKKFPALNHKAFRAPMVGGQMALFGDEG